MKYLKWESINKRMSFIIGILIVLTIMNCSSDNNTEQPAVSIPRIIVTGSLTGFNPTNVLSFSESKFIEVNGSDLLESLKVVVSDNFQVSKANSSFSDQIEFTKEQANAGKIKLYVRFAPQENAIGVTSGTLKLNSSQASEKSIYLKGEGLSITPLINILGKLNDFGNVELQNQSDVLEIIINGDNLTDDINIIVTGEFEVSIDGVTFSKTLTINSATVNDNNTLFSRFAPVTLGSASETITISSTSADNVALNIKGTGIPLAHSYTTFNKQIIGPSGQWNTKNFTIHNDISNISKIKMFVKLDCEAGGCPPWDVFGNLLIKDTDSGNFYELGRFITPYGRNTSQLERGFEFDVTDFKSILQGTVELRTHIQTWSKRWLLTVEFDFEEGTPDYPYYAVSAVFNYGYGPQAIPYGKAHGKDLTRTITVPANAESTHLRTAITGWGHATPVDADGRPCAEWCYRTHDVKIDNENTFSHYMGPIGCGNNPIAPQNGNWAPDRAGWCPGMGVPIRRDDFNSNIAGKSFDLEYDFEDWTTDGGNTSGNPGAFYSLSQFIVVKSNTEIVKPTVIE